MSARLFNTLLTLFAIVAVGVIIAAACEFLRECRRAAHARSIDRIVQTNIPGGMWARTRGDALEIGHYRDPGNQYSGGWRTLFSWSSPHPVSVLIWGPRGPLGVQLCAPYSVRVLPSGRVFDTRDGPRVILRDEFYNKTVEVDDYR